MLARSHFLFFDAFQKFQNSNSGFLDVLPEPPLGNEDAAEDALRRADGPPIRSHRQSLKV
jgi:hypothetical protein